MKFRTILDKVMMVRPRTKEFLIGHPALFLGIGFLLKRRREWGLCLVALGMLGQVSLLNTFCHIHTPLSMSLMRAANGLVLGLIIGYILWRIFGRSGQKNGHSRVITMSSKKIVLSGYYGFSNCGDEGVLSSIVAGLKSRLSGEITVLSASPEDTSKLYDVNAVPRYSLGEVSRAIRDCDLLISGGGSLIQDATSMRSLIYYLSVIAMAKHYGRKIMVLGQGIGPLRRPVSQRLAARTLNGVDLITVRDAPSAQLLNQIGVTKPSIHVTADPTFALQPCSDTDACKLLQEAGIGDGEDVVAISLRSWPEAPEIEKIAVEALGLLSEKLPARLLLVAMHIPDDMDMAKRIQ